MGAVFLANQSYLDSRMQVRPMSVFTGNKATDGHLLIDEKNGKLVNILDDLNSEAYYSQYAKYLSEMNQTAVIGSLISRESIGARLLIGKIWCNAEEDFNNKTVNLFPLFNSLRGNQPACLLHWMT